jgi:hypothetical protein
MTEVDFSRLLSELSQVATALNRESDSINSIIDQFQTKLRAINVGIEVWVDLHGFHQTRLGWTKGAKDWELQVEQPNNFGPAPLPMESRDIRIAALKAFPELLRQLKVLAEAAVRTIQDAKKFVK